MADLTLTNTIESLNTAFTKFKSDIDDRFLSIEKKAARPNIEINTDANFGELRDLMLNKSMNSLTAPDGGAIVPTNIDTSIAALVERQSPIRQISNVINITSGYTNLPVNLRGTTSGWVGEEDARAETATATFDNIELKGGTVYALPIVSEELEQDALVDMETFISQNVVDQFAAKESQAFISGTGSKMPTGFLNGTPVATGDDARDVGVLQYIASGKASALPDDMLGALNNIVYSLKAGYRQAEGCAWVMSTDTLAAISNIKDTTGRPIYMPSVREGLFGTLLGYNVVECEHMPAVAANAFPIAFGNWKRGYTIADRTQLSVLRDPYSYKGKVCWYFRKRVYGGVVNSEALKLLKIAAS
jgi:HK97 family phage major capsid protein